MLPDRVSNPGPLTYESGALPMSLRGPENDTELIQSITISHRQHKRKRSAYIPDDKRSQKKKNAHGEPNEQLFPKQVVIQLH